MRYRIHLPCESAQPHCLSNLFSRHPPCLRCKIKFPGRRHRCPISQGGVSADLRRSLHDGNQRISRRDLLKRGTEEEGRQSGRSTRGHRRAEGPTETARETTKQGATGRGRGKHDRHGTGHVQRRARSCVSGAWPPTRVPTPPPAPRPFSVLPPRLRTPSLNSAGPASTARSIESSSRLSSAAARSLLRRPCAPSAWRRAGHTAL